MKSKKLIITISIFLLLFSLIGCGGNDSQSRQDKTNSTQLGTRDNPYIISENLEITLETCEDFNKEATATWHLSNFETFDMRSVGGTAEIENLMFDISLESAYDSNKSYSIQDYLLITQISDNMNELYGYSISEIILDSNDNYENDKMFPQVYTESKIKAGIVPYRQGLTELDEAPTIKYYCIYYYEPSTGQRKQIWLGKK